MGSALVSMEQWRAYQRASGNAYGATADLFLHVPGRLLWPWIAKVHPRFKTPYIAQIFTGIAVALFAGFLDIGTAAELCNIGTLFAFCIVCGGWRSTQDTPGT